MPIVGTAGHVDHGKSTLVQMLTGTDPDRWAEEKARGLTIDLGFASARIGDHEVGFVDVPGHERFIKNMLAGVVGVDCALLVVSADGGWMPQTEEHARILDLIGAPIGVIAITRIDLVDHELVELASLEAAEEVAGTSLADWPVVPVSAKTGDGIEVLRAAISDALDRTTADVERPFRMWVDRSFHIHGAGVVVTGTVERGELAVDETVEILPGLQTARVRGLQQHDQTVPFVRAGSRAAVNLGNVDLDDIERGHMIATPRTMFETGRFVATWRPSRGFDSLPQRGAFHVHTGTADAAGSIRRLTDDLLLISTVSPIALNSGDRIVIRESGRQAVVGGGVVLHPSPPARIRKRLITILNDTDRPAADRLLSIDEVLPDESLQRQTGGSVPTDGTLVGGDWVVNGLNDRVANKAKAIVAEYHEQHPLRPGVEIAPLSDRIGYPRPVVIAAIDATEALTIEDGYVAAPDFAVTLDETDRRASEFALATLEKSYAVPRASNLDLAPDLLHALIRRGDFVQIDTDLVFTKEQIERITGDLTALPTEFTVSEFGNHFGMARRHSVPLLEWFDKRAITRRSGDTRTVRNGATA